MHDLISSTLHAWATVGYGLQQLLLTFHVEFHQRIDQSEGFPYLQVWGECKDRPGRQVPDLSPREPPPRSLTRDPLQTRIKHLQERRHESKGLHQTGKDRRQTSFADSGIEMDKLYFIHQRLTQSVGFFLKKRGLRMYVGWTNIFPLSPQWNPIDEWRTRTKIKSTLWLSSVSSPVKPLLQMIRFWSLTLKDNIPWCLPLQCWTCPEKRSMQSVKFSVYASCCK